jgi:hypothetical protein
VRDEAQRAGLGHRDRVSDLQSITWAGRGGKEFTLNEIRSQGKTARAAVRYMSTDKLGYFALVAMENGDKLRVDEKGSFFDNFQLLK